MTIQEAQLRIDEWIKKYGVRYFDELTNLAILMEEVGEFSRWVARAYGEQSFKHKEDKDQVKEKLADEAADIFFVLLCLCNQMGIDMEEALQKNLDKKTERDADRHRNNTKLL